MGGNRDFRAHSALPGVQNRVIRCGYGSPVSYTSILSICSAATTLAAFCLGWTLRFCLGFFAGMDGGSVAANVSSELLAIVGFDQRLVDRLWPAVAGELVKSA